jgi:malate dehydrogenase (oxaloacetate-decarboxylating)
MLAEKWRVCAESYAARVDGGAGDAMRGADACIAFTRSGPGIIRPEWVEAMAPDAIVLACANPVPEIWPWEATEAGARIVCTGRSDFPNQVNNSLVFPGLFRGVLDVRARAITDEMAIAAARELADCVDPAELREDRILPRMDEWRIAARVAAATGMQAQAQGVAALSLGRQQLYDAACAIIGTSRAASAALVEAGLIAPIPEQ